MPLIATRPPARGQGLPALSAELLRAVRHGDAAATDLAEAAVAALHVDQLATDISDDATRTAVWINLYNAATQRLMDRDAAAYARRARFFRQPAVTVAGTTLSLDTIEHGLLRRSRLKLGLGYIGYPFAGRFARRFRVARVDPRIHFALNCAARELPADRRVRGRPPGCPAGPGHPVLPRRHRPPGGRSPGRATSLPLVPGRLPRRGRGARVPVHARRPERRSPPRVRTLGLDTRAARVARR